MGVDIDIAQLGMVVLGDDGCKVVDDANIVEADNTKCYRINLPSGISCPAGRDDTVAKTAAQVAGIGT